MTKRDGWRSDKDFALTGGIYMRDAESGPVLAPIWDTALFPIVMSLTYTPTPTV